MPALLDRLLRRAPPAPAAEPPAPAGRRDRPPAPAMAALREDLAAKLLHAWAENRQQVRVPLALNLASMTPGARALVVQALGAALAADGRRDAAETARLRAALRRIGGTPAEAAAAGHPPDLFPLLRALEEAGLGPHGYAAAALVLDPRDPAQRAFLDWLAARLGVPADLAAGIARRYRR